MALLWMDGFEAGELSPYTVSGASVATSQYRTGARSIAFGSNQWFQRALGASPQTVIVGAGMSIPAYGTYCDLYDGSTVQLRITLASGAITVHRGPGTTLLGTHPVSWLLNVWQYLEVMATIDPTNGSYELRVNGATIGSGTGLNTRNSGASQVTAVRFTGTSSGNTVDDVYVCDTTGSYCNTFLGPVRVSHLAPTSDASTTWSRNGGSNNYGRLTDILPDGDTTYVYSTTPDAVDRYGLADLPAEAYTVAAVASVMYVRRDGGTLSVAPLMRSGAATSEGSAVAPGSTYAAYFQPFYTDPATGLAWTVAGINGAEIGLKVIA